MSKYSSVLAELEKHMCMPCHGSGSIRGMTTPSLCQECKGSGWKNGASFSLRDHRVQELEAFIRRYRYRLGGGPNQPLIDQLLGEKQESP